MDKCVEVAFATPEKQLSLSVQFVEGASVQQVIEKSGILAQCAEIDLTTMPVGIYGKICKLDAVVTKADRVEIYRPLLQNPMDARRNRAVKV